VILFSGKVSKSNNTLNDFRDSEKKFAVDKVFSQGIPLYMEWGALHRIVDCIRLFFNHFCGEKYYP